IQYKKIANKGQTPAATGISKVSKRVGFKATNCRKVAGTSRKRRIVYFGHLEYAGNRQQIGGRVETAPNC
ncbi:MAG TPA: hypothetical protein VHQ94_03920, partial [Pyrinomonadaceae bacterium]|nr:hypothetical protein [Pyrinomonadaceae bacterium]